MFYISIVNAYICEYIPNYYWEYCLGMYLLTFFPFLISTRSVAFSHTEFYTTL
jgi:hypothetical protein